ncbi:hypothetical protein V1517DRAFT_323546 [Lipomyces orientalis]|uniref:Uncharacterized protein n=1 Tax=Lipomyces orientalis TaxID=1233043 RepID=A0ACC3TNM3_9ASCO
MMTEEEFVDDESMVRRRPADFILKDNTEIIDIRAFQRTYEGAYLRTAMLEVTFSLSLLRIFDIEFYPVGAAFVVIGFSFMMIGLFRRIMSNRYILNGKPAKYFLTSGTPIFIMSTVCIISYIVIIPEIFRLQ